MASKKEPRWTSLNASARHHFGPLCFWYYLTGGYGWEARVGIDVGTRTARLVVGNCRRGDQEKNVQLRYWRR